MTSGQWLGKILLIGAIGVLTMSCAPLKPLGPQASPALRTPQNVQKITGIDEWDKVLLPWLGTPYLYGGTTKKGTDCSGFTSSVYLEKEGMRLPRTSGDQFNSGKSINRNKLAATDLVFFGERGKVTHVGIYVGNGNFIHASTSAGVTITQLDNNYWKSRYMGARRYL